jgi:hypothetical protein
MCIKYKFLQLKFVLTIGNNDPVLASLERPKEVPQIRWLGHSSSRLKIAPAAVPGEMFAK